MSAPLPLALRSRFQQYIAAGLSGRAAAKRLLLSPATGVRWQKQLRIFGTLTPAVQGRPRGHGKLAPHQAFFEELVAQDGDMTLPELAGALKAATGVVVHSTSIGRFLCKLGYSYKKIAGCHRKAAPGCKATEPGLDQAAYVFDAKTA